jgi:hypothetical protein
MSLCLFAKLILPDLTLSRFAKNGRKKSSKSFSDLLLPVPLWGGGIFSCK